MLLAAAGAVSASLAGAWYLAPMAARRRAEAQLRAACRSSGVLVLTYDDGPGEELTPRVLDLLRAREAKATFFLSGSRAAEHPAIVDRMSAEGHEIGCHGHDHVNAWRTWPWRGLRDVRAGYDALAGWIPADGTFRPPYGKLTAATWAAVRRRGARLGWWTSVAGDVDDDLPSPTAALARVDRAGGGVVLLHDFDREPPRGEFVLRSTELLLDGAARRGWRLRTLGELLGSTAAEVAA